MISSILLAQALTVNIVAGGISTLSSQDAYSISPTASIETYAELANNQYAPDLQVKIDLSSLPEEDFDLTNAATFKSIEFRIGLAQPIPIFFCEIYGGFGLATRLPGEDKPRIRAATYFTGGIRFATDDDSSYIYVGGGADERLSASGLYEAAAHIEGMLKLYSYKDAKLSLKGDAILAGQSSLVRVGIVVGI